MVADDSLHWLDNLNQSLNMMVILIESCDGYHGLFICDQWLLDRQSRLELALTSTHLDSSCLALNFRLEPYYLLLSLLLCCLITLSIMHNTIHVPLCI